MESHPLKHLDSLENESIWVKVCLKKVKPIYICVVYRPPTTNVSDLESTDRLCAYLKQCNRKLPHEKEVFILGDFNCNMLSKNALSSKIKDLCSSLSLKQLIEESTRITPQNSTLLDLILTNSDNVSQSGVFHSGISDHSLVYQKIQKAERMNKIKVCTFKNFVDEDFLNLRLAGSYIS